MQGAIIERIGARIQGLRKQHGMTQHALAMASGIAQGNISRIERGLVSDVQLTTIVRLARVFGVTVEDLMEDEMLDRAIGRDQRLLVGTVLVTLGLLVLGLPLAWEMLDAIWGGPEGLLHDTFAFLPLKALPPLRED